MSPGENRIRPRTFRTTDLLVISASALAALSIAWLIFFRLTPAGGGPGFLVAFLAGFILIYWMAARGFEGKLMATERLAATLTGLFAMGLLTPLILIIGFVLVKGVRALNWAFFSETLQFVGPLDAASKGGALHAIVGTLEQITIAGLISVPLGFATAIFLNEVGGVLKKPVRIFVDAMSGIPSIVAGLFIYAVWIIELGHHFSGLAAGLALSVLMLPTVTRTAEEVLRLVPGGLREASLALGASEWRTTWAVVLPTAKAGLVTAAILGVARAVGETAPLIMTSFGASVLNANPLKGTQDSLPLFVYNLLISPQKVQIDRAWTGALVLICLVLILFTLARIAGGGIKFRRPRLAPIVSEEAAK